MSHVLAAFDINSLLANRQRSQLSVCQQPHGIHLCTVQVFYAFNFNHCVVRGNVHSTALLQQLATLMGSPSGSAHCLGKCKKYYAYCNLYLKHRIPLAAAYTTGNCRPWQLINFCWQLPKCPSALPVIARQCAEGYIAAEKRTVPGLPMAVGRMFSECMLFCILLFRPQVLLLEIVNTR